MQRGYLYKRNGSWLLRYYDTVIESGKTRRVQVATKIGDVKDYPAKSAVRLLADKHLAPLNAKETTPESSQTVSEFIELVYFPASKSRLRASTIKGYNDIFNVHVKSRLGSIRLRDFRTVHGQRMLAEVASLGTVGHKSLLRVKSFLSGVFTFAQRQGILDGANPMHAVSVEGRVTRFKGAAYSAPEIWSMFVQTSDLMPWEPGHEEYPNPPSYKPANLPPVARMVVAVAALTGLRASEIRGLRWGDFDGENLHIRRAVWRTVVGETKTPESEAAVPVVPILRDALIKFRNNAPDSAYIFAGERRGAPLNLHNLARRVIIPAFKPAKIAWRGWHAFRRGTASILFDLGADPKIIQGVLRHASMTTTMQIYVQAPSDAAREAMKKLGDSIAPFGI